MGIREEEVVQRLHEKFENAMIQAFDLNGEGKNFEISILHESFKNMNRVQQHQAVMAVFSKELKSGEIHALKIQTSY